MKTVREANRKEAELRHKLENEDFDNEIAEDWEGEDLTDEDDATSSNEDIKENVLQNNKSGDSMLKHYLRYLRILLGNRDMYSFNCLFITRFKMKYAKFRACHFEFSNS